MDDSKIKESVGTRNKIGKTIQQNPRERVQACHTTVNFDFFQEERNLEEHLNSASAIKTLTLEVLRTTRSFSLIFLRPLPEV